MIQELVRFWAGSAVSVFHLACVVYVALAWSRSAFGKEALHVRLCAALVAGFWIPCAVFVALIPFGLFDRVWTSALLAVLFSGVYACYGKGYNLRADLQQIGCTLRETWRQLPSYVRWLTGAVGVVFTIRFCRGMIAPPLAWDALTYHLLKAGRWVQSGGWVWDNAPDAWQFYEWFPPLGDVYWAWAMLGTHTDAYVGMTSGIMVIFLALAMWSFCRTLGLSPRLCWMGMLCVVSSPAVASFISACYVDNTVALLSVTAASLSVSSFNGKSLRLAATAIVAAGLATGIKITVLPLLFVCGLIFLLVAWKQRGGHAVSVFRITVVAAAALAVAVFWQIYLVLIGKTPFYPIPFRLFSYEIEAGAPEFVKYHLEQKYVFPYWWEVSRSFWNFLWVDRDSLTDHLNFTWFFPVILAWGLHGFIKSLRKNKPEKLIGHGLIFLCGMAMLAVYWTPGHAAYREIWISNSGRLLIFSYALLVACLFLSVDRLVWPVALTLLLVNVWYIIPWKWTALDLAAASGGLILTGLILTGFMLTTALSPIRDGRCLLLVSAVVFLGASGGLFFARTEVRNKFYRHIGNVYDVNPIETNRFSSSVTERLDKFTEISINVCGDYTGKAYVWYRYPLLGTRLQNQVVYASPTVDGSIGNQSTGEFRALDFDKWYERLEKKEVTHVVTLTPSVTEMSWMKSRPSQFKLIVEDEASNWALWQLY